MNFLFCNAWKHAQIIKDFKETLGDRGRIISTSKLTDYPSLYLSDAHYVLRDVHSPQYIPQLLEICKLEEVDAILTIVDLETEILAKNREKFRAIGVDVMVSDIKTATICRDKFKMYEHMHKHGIKTMKTYKTLASFDKACDQGDIKFPIFVKPCQGHGSLNIEIVHEYLRLEVLMDERDDLIIQEYIPGEDIDVDAYADSISHEIVALYSKKKIYLPAKEEALTESFHDPKLLELVQKIAQTLDFKGPLNFDFIRRNEDYYLVEINPRFGAGYIHTHEEGVNFIEMMIRNLEGIENTAKFWNYDEKTVMMKYEVPLVLNKSELYLKNI